VLRLYAIADGDGGWTIMPGGLTRIADRQDEVSMQRGGSSADTWVVTGEAVDPFTMLPGRLGPDEVVFRRRIVSSRAAENLFWLGRYTERTDNCVRAAQRILGTLRTAEEPAESVREAIARIAAALGLVPAAAPKAGERPPRDFERRLLAGLGDESASSVAFDLRGLAGSAAQIRDRMATEHWRQIEDTFEAYRGALSRSAAAVGEGGAGEGEGEDADSLFAAGPGEPALEDALAALSALVPGISAITGAQTDGMTRDDGWHLLTVGRQIERLLATCEILLAFFGTRAVLHETGFDHVLALLNCTVTYRSRYQGQRELAALVDLLALEEANPRSLACAVDAIGRELAFLSDATEQELDWPAAARFHRPRRQLLEELCGGSGPEQFGALLELARSLAQSARRLSDLIGLRFFSHSESLRSQIL
jgi:uncharacterized alpha-E superfamily protein